eukprot:6824379-Pyramimonas_sp.AAC.1
MLLAMLAAALALEMLSELAMKSCAGCASVASSRCSPLRSRSAWGTSSAIGFEPAPPSACGPRRSISKA